MENLIRKNYKPDSIKFYQDWEENHIMSFNTVHQIGVETEKTEPGGGGAKIYYKVPIYGDREDYVFDISEKIDDLIIRKIIKDDRIIDTKELEIWLFQNQSLIIKPVFNLNQHIEKFLEEKHHTNYNNFEDFLTIGLIAGKKNNKYILYIFKDDIPTETEECYDTIKYNEIDNIFELQTGNKKGFAYENNWKSSNFKNYISKKIIITDLTTEQIQIISNWIVINKEIFIFQFKPTDDFIQKLSLEDKNSQYEMPEQISNDLFIVKRKNLKGVFSIHEAKEIISLKYKKIEARKEKKEYSYQKEKINYFLTDQNLIFIKENYHSQTTSLYTLEETDNLPSILENNQTFQIKANEKWGFIFPKPINLPICFSDEKILKIGDFYRISISGHIFNVHKNIISSFPYFSINKTTSFVQIEEFKANSTSNYFKATDKNNLVTILNNKLSPLIEYSTADEIHFIYGRFILKIDEKFKIVNDDGTINHNYFFESLPRIYLNKYISGKLNGTFRIYTIEGKQISNLNIDTTPIQINESHFIIKNNKYGIIDIKGNIILDTNYDDILIHNQKPLSENNQSQIKIEKPYITLINNNLYQVFNLRKKTVYNLNSESFPEFKNGLYIIKRNNLFGIVSKENNILLPFHYTKIEYINSPHWFTITKCFKNGHFDLFHFQSEKIIIENINSIYFKEINVNSNKWTYKEYIKTFILIEKNDEQYYLSPNFPYSTTKYTKTEELVNLYWQDRSIAF